MRKQRDLLLECSSFTLPSCARCSGHRHSEGEALGGETENLLHVNVNEYLSQVLANI